MKDTDIIEVFDKEDSVGYHISIKQLKEHLFGVKSEDAPKKTVKKAKKDEK